jgi:5-methylcytosine-specific restriction protein A
MKIEPRDIEEIYALAINVYHKKIEKNEAIEKAVELNLMSKGSAADYIQNLKYLLSGHTYKTYKRTMNLAGTEFFLRKIRDDFGQNVFDRALKTSYKHVKYYNSLGHGKQVQTEQLLDKLKEELSQENSMAVYPDEVNVNPLFEGAIKNVSINAYERNAKARKICIDYHKPVCCVCSFDFSSHYGEIGKNFIHVHHIVDLSQIDGEYEVDPINDLCPVCPNCHAMLHTQQPAMHPSKLKAIIHSHNARVTSKSR